MTYSSGARMDKAARQRTLLRLVKNRPIANQTELVRLLEREGLSSTQASVSRDVRELGLIKTNGRYLLPERLGRRVRGRTDGVERALITSVAPVGANLVVVRTEIGAATRVALELDKKSDADIAGTVAGDDTIFVAVRSRSAQGRVVAMLRRLSPN